MKIIIHRGTHEIGGCSTEYSTATTRIIIDLGKQLSLDPDFVPQPLDIAGVTDENGRCDAVFFTHNHEDHVGQIYQLRDGVPMYFGAFSKRVLLASLQHKAVKEDSVIARIESANTFMSGVRIQIGDIRITPYHSDHSACDSYMFLIEADGQRVLHTGDFRLTGYFDWEVLEYLAQIGHVGTVVCEGTHLSRVDEVQANEADLAERLKDYIETYKYVCVLISSTNLERIANFSLMVPKGKYFMVDPYVHGLLNDYEAYMSFYSDAFFDLKKTYWSRNQRNSETLLTRMKERGGVFIVRDNPDGRFLLSQFDRDQTIILYSMWDGYRTQPVTTIPEFLALAGRWESFHTSGHASRDAIRRLLSMTTPDRVLPMHTEEPEGMLELYAPEKVVLLQDGQVLDLPTREAGWW